MADYEDYSKYSGDQPPEPITPSSEMGVAHHPPESGSQGRTQGETDHAYLILVLGILSLTCCFPLGIIAWVMGNREMAKIRQGRIPPGNSSIIRVGRALGVIGVLMTALFLILSGFVMQKDWIQNPWETFSPKPLDPKHVAYVGHWEGNKGTVIDIKARGVADFKTGTTSVKGGVVKIENNTLSINVLGIKKEWIIRQPPILEESGWLMQLDDEVFRKLNRGRLAIRGNHQKKYGPRLN
jgi:hypothetical protein